MAIQPEDFLITSDEMKSRAIIRVRDEFTRAMLKRFYEIESSIEDVWDLVNAPAQLLTRMRNLAGKSPGQLDQNDMRDIALCAMFLHNLMEE